MESQNSADNSVQVMEDLSDDLGEKDGKLRNTLEEVEKDLVCEALRDTGGNKAKAARILGITERMMGLRVAKYGINPREFRTRR